MTRALHRLWFAFLDRFLDTKVCQIGNLLSRDDDGAAGVVAAVCFALFVVGAYASAVIGR